jgi:hypothetical protein
MRREIMKSKISICILLCLTILASGMAAAQGEWPTSVPAADQGASLASGLATGQASPLAACPQYGQAAAEGSFGTKVKSGDTDVGLPLSTFAAIPGPNPAATAQNTVYISYWDVGATPGIYDDQDVVYLQFGSALVPPTARIVRTNNIRLTGWGTYPAGSYVKQGDSDMGQQLLPWFPAPNPTAFASGITTGFSFMNVVGSTGYDLDDPVYLKTVANPFVPASTNTNDIRITANAGFPAGSRVSLNDPDAALPLSPFNVVYTANGGPLAPLPPLPAPIATLSFYNANGNVMGIPPGSAIYDTGDFVYFDVNPIGIVSPNDVRLY